MREVIPNAKRRLGIPGLRRALVLIAVTMSLAAGAAAAELHVEGPAACLDGQELAFRLERTLGRPLEGVAPFRVNVTVSGTRAHRSARIEMIDEAASERMERVVSASDCGDLADAITVVVALALDSRTTANEGEPAAAGQMEIEAPPQSAPEPPPLVAADEGARAASAESTARGEASVVRGEGMLEPAVSVWVVGDAGSLPAPGLGASLGVELGAESWQLRAQGTLFVDQRHQVGSAAGGAPGAELRLVTGALLGCVVPVGSASSPLQLRACTGWELGRLSGTGTGVAAPRRGNALWSAPLVELGVLWPISGTRLKLGALIVAAAPLGRDDFVLRDVGHVHRPGSVVGRAALGAAFALE
jgi:hypothetical protein